MDWINFDYLITQAKIADVGELRVAATNKSIRRGGLVFWPDYSGTPKVTYNKYAPLGVP